MRLAEDNTSNISLSEIFKQYCHGRGLESDCALVTYYDRLAHHQTHGDTITTQALQGLYTQIQTSVVPRTILREWVEQTFATNTDFWAFRKQVGTLDPNEKWALNGAH